MKIDPRNLTDLDENDFKETNGPKISKIRDPFKNNLAKKKCNHRARPERKPILSSL